MTTDSDRNTYTSTNTDINTNTNTDKNIILFHIYGAHIRPIRGLPVWIVTLGLNDDDNCWTMSSIAANDENLTYYIPQESEVPQLRTPTMKIVMVIPSPKQGVVQKS